MTTMIVLGILALIATYVLGIGKEMVQIGASLTIIIAIIAAILMAIVLL